MDDLQTALQSLLADPQQLAELSALVSSLGLGAPTQPASPPAASPAEQPLPSAPPSPPPPGLSPRGGIDSRSEKLLLSLRPFLKPERQQKLDRAIRLAGLMQLASSTLRPPD